LAIGITTKIQSSPLYKPTTNLNEQKNNNDCQRNILALIGISLTFLPDEIADLAGLPTSNLYYLYFKLRVHCM